MISVKKSQLSRESLWRKEMSVKKRTREEERERKRKM